MKQDRIVPDSSASAEGGTAYRYSLWLLTTIYIFNFIDRQIVTIVAEPIKQEFALADWQVGAMTGLSFALLYTLLGLPIARIAERGDRSRIIAIAVISWSLFTALCGIAQNFTQLVLARIGVGLGEAGCTPPAHSLISDIAPRQKRASALAIYSMGAPLGQLIGMAMGGIVAAHWGWRSVFFVAGAPGILLAALAFLTLPEPRRAAQDEFSPHDAPSPGFGQSIATLITNRSFLLVAGGAAAGAFVFYGLSAFYGSFFLRNHAGQLQVAAAHFGLPPLGLLGLALGLSSGVAGIAGAVGGGRAADAWVQHNAAAYVLLPALCTIAAVPLLMAAMIIPDLWWSIGLIALASALNSAWVGAAYAAGLGLVQPRTRATASALMLFVLNLIGLGLGPLCVGLLSDMFADRLGAAAGLRWGMACATLAGAVAAGLFWQARKSLPRDTVS